MSEIDHEHTTSIVCPYCGHKFTDSWEYQEDEDDVQCESCDKSFSLGVHVSVTYTTTRKPCSDEHRWGEAEVRRYTAERDAEIVRGCSVLKPRGAHAVWTRTCLECESNSCAYTAMDGTNPWSTPEAL